MMKVNDALLAAVLQVTLYSGRAPGLPRLFHNTKNKQTNKTKKAKPNQMKKQANPLSQEPVAAVKMQNILY